MLKSIESQISAVVVTFNRRDLLIHCIEAILAQTRPVSIVFIVDNNSSDGTETELSLRLPLLFNAEETATNSYTKSWLIRENPTAASADIPCRLKINYIRLLKNTGSAGGQFIGMAAAAADGADYLWVMDDDGRPSKTCLECLMRRTADADLLGPLVVNPDQQELLSFGTYRTADQPGIKTRKEAESRAVKGLLRNTLNPFNGILVSKKVIDLAGLPKPDLFIWGDEVEYLYRALKAKLRVATIVDAIFFHPPCRKRQEAFFCEWFYINYQESRIRNYYDYRNQAYIYAIFDRNQLFKMLVKYTIYFTLKARFRDLMFFANATYNGLTENWKRPSI